MDSSGSIGPQNFYTMLGFAKMLVDSMNINPAYTRVALETFATENIIQFDLDDYQTKIDVINAMSFPYRRGTTNTAQALRVMRETLFSAARGNRPNARDVGIVITDGRSNDKEQTFKEAVKNREAGIQMLSVAVNLQVRGLRIAPSLNKFLFTL
jgi:collagen type VI alpha